MIGYPHLHISFSPLKKLREIEALEITGRKEEEGSWVQLHLLSRMRMMPTSAETDMPPFLLHLIHIIQITLPSSPILPLKETKNRYHWYMRLDIQFSLTWFSACLYHIWFNFRKMKEIWSRSRTSGQLQVMQLANLIRTEFPKLDFNIVYLRGVETNLLCKQRETIKK